MEPPNGFDDLVARFGDPRKFIRGDGTLSAEWEAQYITRIALPLPLPLAGTEDVQVTHITCHVLAAAFVSDTLEFLSQQNLWDSLVSYGGGFNFRLQRGSGAKLSVHAWGLAWDFDPDDNELGTDGTMDPDVVKLFESRGFLWGGHFSERKDPMHFQFCKGY